MKAYDLLRKGVEDLIKVYSRGEDTYGFRSSMERLLMHVDIARNADEPIRIAQVRPERVKAVAACGDFYGHLVASEWPFDAPKPTNLPNGHAFLVRLEDGLCCKCLWPFEDHKPKSVLAVAVDLLLEASEPEPVAPEKQPTPRPTSRGESRFAELASIAGDLIPESPAPDCTCDRKGSALFLKIDDKTNVSNHRQECPLYKYLYDRYASAAWRASEK